MRTSHFYTFIVLTLTACDENASYSVEQEIEVEYVPTKAISREEFAEDVIFSISGTISNEHYSYEYGSYNPPSDGARYGHYEKVTIDHPDAELVQLDVTLGGTDTPLKILRDKDQPIDLGVDVLADEQFSGAKWTYWAQITELSTEGEEKSKRSEGCGSVEYFEGKKTYEVRIHLYTTESNPDDRTRIVLLSRKNVKFHEAKCRKY